MLEWRDGTATAATGAGTGATGARPGREVARPGGNRRDRGHEIVGKKGAKRPLRDLRGRV